MSSTTRSDVKNHLSARGRAGSGPFLAVIEPDATGFSAAESAENKTGPTCFVEDYIGEHSPLGISIVPNASRSSEN